MSDKPKTLGDIMPTFKIIGYLKDGTQRVITSDSMNDVRTDDEVAKIILMVGMDILSQYPVQSVEFAEDTPDEFLGITKVTALRDSGEEADVLEFPAPTSVN